MTASVMTRLREETAELHGAAEGHPFQRRLAKGDLPKESYTRWLVDMLWIHRAISGSARANPVTALRSASVFSTLREKTPHLEADLAHLGVDPERAEPTEAARAEAGELVRLGQAGRAAALELLGCQYVLEGSTNGGRFIARNVRRAYDLTDDGVRYLDPYGEAQRERWAEFRLEVDGAGFEGADADAIVAGAKRMFAAIARVSEALLRTVPGEEGVAVRLSERVVG